MLTCMCVAAAYTMVDKTGAMAPLWRQLKGDIAYLVVHAHDSAETVYVTASTHGYFVNGARISRARHCEPQANAPVASYWLRRVPGDGGGRRD